MSMTRLKVRDGMTLAEYMECVGPPVRKFVLHLPGWRPITVDRRQDLTAESTLLGSRVDDWLCTEAAFQFGDEGEPLIVSAHVWAKPRPPPAAPVDVPID